MDGIGWVRFCPSEREAAALGEKNNKRKWEFKESEIRKSSSGQKDLRVQMNDEEREIYDMVILERLSASTECHRKNILFLKPLATRTSGRQDSFYVKLVPKHCRQDRQSNKND